MKKGKSREIVSTIWAKYYSFQPIVVIVPAKDILARFTNALGFIFRGYVETVWNPELFTKEALKELKKNNPFPKIRRKL